MPQVLGLANNPQIGGLSGLVQKFRNSTPGGFQPPAFFLICFQVGLNNRARTGAGDDTQVVNTEQMRGVEPHPMRLQSDTARERVKFTD